MTLFSLAQCGEGEGEEEEKQKRGERKQPQLPFWQGR